MKCPGCGKHLQLRSNPSPASQARQRQPVAATAGESSSDSLFGDLDAPAAPLFSNATTAPPSRPAAGHPFPKTNNASLRTRNPRRKNSKFFHVALAVGVGLPTLATLAGIVVGFIEGPNKGRTTPTTANALVSRAPTIAQSSKPITQEEAISVAKNFERELKSESARTANQMVHWENVVNRGMHDFDISDSLRAKFAAGAVKGLKNRNWAHVIKTQTAGNVSLLRTRTRDGAMTALYRTRNTSGVAKLEQQVGGDPALQVLEANVHIQQGEMAKAKMALEKAIELDPNYQEAKTLLSQLT